MLATLLEPTSGQAYVDGVDVVRNPLEVRRLIGYPGQEAVAFRAGDVPDYVTDGLLDPVLEAADRFAAR